MQKYKSLATTPHFYFAAMVFEILSIRFSFYALKPAVITQRKPPAANIVKIGRRRYID